MRKIYAKTTDEITEREIRNANLAGRMASECIVLLKNNGTLPLKSIDKIALYGGGARGTIKGGTGSGDVNTRSNTSIEQGLIDIGASVTTGGWLDKNEALQKKAKDDYRVFIDNKSKETGIPSAYLSFNYPYEEPDIAAIEDDDIDKDTDTAILVIARISGEGVDRKVRKGDYLPGENELAGLKKLTQNYKHVILVLNVGGIMNMEEIEAMEGIDAIVLMSQLGNLGGKVLADMLIGKTTPSGHLSDTWAVDYMDYPSSAGFGQNDGNVHEDYYRDGIFVGYRYFDTFGKNVVYPFGFGLSYTEFSVNIVNVAQNNDKIELSFKIKNIGEIYKGKALVQVYVSAPGNKQDMPYQELKAWVKSDELAPGQEQEVKASFAIASLASYYEDASNVCDGTNKSAVIQAQNVDSIKKAIKSGEYGCYMIEAGDYIVRYGEDSRHTKPAALLRVKEDIVTEICRHICNLDEDFESISPDDIKDKADIKAQNEAEESTCKEEEQGKCYAKLIEPDVDCIRTVINVYTDKREELIDKHPGETLTIDDVREGKCTLNELVAQLSVDEMAKMCVGTLRSDSGDIIVADAFDVPGAAGDTSRILAQSRHVDTLLMADGPAGLRLQPHFKTDSEGHILPGGAVFGDLVEPWPDDTPEDAVDYYQYCTAIPIGWALAQSWNTGLVESVGEMIGSEMEEFAVSLWLAPAMNIHRNPLCGRYFEYYSEDPLLSGKIAAAMTKGVQKIKGRGTTIKHFAANNQEDNRYFVNVHIKERALREIYLKGFEIAVKESAPSSVMTSYNLINGIHTPNSIDLIQYALRDEWGFDGMVMTDWLTSQDVPGLTGKFGAHYPISASTGCIYAGNDIQMPGCEKNIEDITEAVNNNKETDGFSINKADLQYCCYNIIRLIMRLKEHDK